MAILAFDTTHGFCSVAIARDSTIIASNHITEMSKQAEMLVPVIEQTLNEASLHYHDIKTIAATVGPGSFTGVRIGLATAHGILLSSAASFYGISALEAVAWQATYSDITPDNATLHVVLDARRGELYLQSFDAKTMEALSAPSLLPIDKATKWLTSQPQGYVIGNGGALVKDHMKNIHQTITNILLPDAVSVAGLTAFKQSHKHKGLDASPLYIRKPDAKLPQKRPV